MKYVQIKPATAWHVNAKLRGTASIPDLPVTRYIQDSRPVTSSLYRVSFWQRLKFLFSGGNIHVSVWAETHPPIAVGIGNLFERGQK